MPISKVKSVTEAGNWESKFGTLYKFEYEMEDGTLLTANHKSVDGAFKIGAEVEYEITNEHPEHGKSGKVKKPDTGNHSSSNAPKPQVNGDVVQLMIVRQSSLKVALDLIRHNAIGDDTKIKADDVEELAGRFTKWVMAEEKPYTPNAVKDMAQDVAENMQG